MDLSHWRTLPPRELIEYFWDILRTDFDWGFDVYVEKLSGSDFDSDALEILSNYYIVYEDTLENDQDLETLKKLSAIFACGCIYAGHYNKICYRIKKSLKDNVG